MRSTGPITIPNNSAISKVPNIFESVIAITYELHIFSDSKCIGTSFCIKMRVGLFVATIQKKREKKNKKIK